jgi:hypothetical protein
MLTPRSAPQPDVDPADTAAQQQLLGVRGPSLSSRCPHPGGVPTLSLCAARHSPRTAAAHWPVRTRPQPPQELDAQKTELLDKVTALRRELTDWRTKLDGQVKNYRDVSPPLRRAAGRGPHAARSAASAAATHAPEQRATALVRAPPPAPTHRPPATCHPPPQDIGDLNKTINSEVSALKEEFAELKGVIKEQIDKTASLAMAQVRARPG